MQQTTAVKTSAVPPRPARPPRRFPVMSFDEVRRMIHAQCAPSAVRTFGRGRHRVAILPEAYERLKHIVCYGRKSPSNILEQKYIGLGHFLVDEAGNVIVVVTHFIEIMTMNRSATHASNFGPNGEYNPGMDFLAYYRDEYIAGEQEYNTDDCGCTVDPFLCVCGASEFVMEGHTHPNIGTFFSSTDRERGSARAGRLPVCVFVCDPIRRSMLAAVGRDLETAQIVAFERAESVPAPKQSALERRAQKLSGTAGDVVRAAMACIQSGLCGGTVRLKRRLDGKLFARIELVTDEAQSADENDGGEGS